VKKFLFQRQTQKGYIGQYSPFKASKNKFRDQIESILAYIKQYHYSNFEDVYAKFDRTENILLDPGFLEGGNDFQPEYYESYSYLGSLTIKDLGEIFQELKQPFETDSKKNIIDYNWHVDGILKNSQSYNKDNTPKENPKAVAISKQDMQLIQKAALKNKNLLKQDSKDFRLIRGTSKQLQMRNTGSSMNTDKDMELNLVNMPSHISFLNNYSLSNLPFFKDNESYSIFNQMPPLAA